MDILDILLDILLKPPQPFMGLFFLVLVINNKVHNGVFKVFLNIVKLFGVMKRRNNNLYKEYTDICQY